MAEQLSSPSDESRFEVQAEALLRSLGEPELDLGPDASSIQVQLLRQSYDYLPKQPFEDMNTHYIEIYGGDDSSYLVYPVERIESGPIAKRVQHIDGSMDYINIIGTLAPDNIDLITRHGLNYVSGFLIEADEIAEPSTLEATVADDEGEGNHQELYLASRQHFVKEAYLVSRPVIDQQGLNKELECGEVLQVEPHIVSINGIATVLYVVLNRRELFKIKGLSRISTSGDVELHFGIGTTH